MARKPTAAQCRREAAREAAERKARDIAELCRKGMEENPAWEFENGERYAKANGATVRPEGAPGSGSGGHAFPYGGAAGA